MVVARRKEDEAVGSAERVAPGTNIYDSVRPVNAGY